MVTGARRMSGEAAEPAVGGAARRVEDGDREGLAAGASDEEIRKGKEADCDGRRGGRRGNEVAAGRGRWWRPVGAASVR
jgi:hypothetical protein